MDETMQGQETEEHHDMEDATLAKLFRSPVKVEYPELPEIEQRSEAVEEAADVEIPEQTEAITETLEQTEAANEAETAEQTETAEIQYPTLPLVKSPETHLSNTYDADKADDVSDSAEACDSDEEFTEASLQLDILRDYQKSSQTPPTRENEISRVEQSQDISENSTEASPAESTPVKTERDDSNETIQTNSPQDHAMTDITDGLVLSLTPTKSASTPRKLDSPPPRLASGAEDTTMTVSFDDDTAMLKDFLNRAAASKAEKAALTTHRRESLQNRRDSDVVRYALASPRKALEEKDPNSPSKHTTELTLDLSQTPTLSAPSETPSPTPDVAVPEGAEEANKGTRRSSRAKKSRLPAPASSGPAPTPKIAIRRNDGNEVVVLKKDDAKVLADLTRANTRKNKQGAFCVTVRLMKAQMEAIGQPPVDDATKEIVVGKNVRWDEQLAYYQENPDTIANALAEAESLATPDELSFSDTGSEPKKKKEKISKTSTPKVRRARGLGTANGTPAKGLTASSSLLPEAVQQEKEKGREKAACPAKQAEIPKPKVAKAKKMPVASTSIDASVSSNTASPRLPSLDVAPVGISSTAAPQRKSRLAAPRKVVLPQVSSSSTSTVGDGKENSTSLRSSSAFGLGLSDATPKKGIPAPKVVVPPSSSTSIPSVAGMESSGLPRRRGKKY